MKAKLSNMCKMLIREWIRYTQCLVLSVNCWAAGDPEPQPFPKEWISLC